MSVNSSLSLLPPHLSSSNSSLHPLLKCFSSKSSIYVFSALFIANLLLLLLPLFVLILYLGYQQWRKQRSISTAATSHSDLFTYHSIAMQLNEFLGFTFIFYGSYTNFPKMTLVGVCIWTIAALGKAQFHVLTCLERYLAVVHPIMYLGLRQADGVRIRNISIGGVWLLSFSNLVILYFCHNEINLIFYFCITPSFFFVVICFCSISVLRALKHPGPGEVGGNRERVDQSKQRAFHTIMAIMGVLLLKFGGNLIANGIYSLAVLSSSDACVMLTSKIWLDLPSCLVLPLLFLHRAGKLQCRKQNTESG